MDVLDAIKMRRSVRSYSTRAIPTDVMERMRQALRFAPAACNLQPWRFIFVTDPQRRSQVAEAASDQRFIADAPVIVVGCGFPAGGPALRRPPSTCSGCPSTCSGCPPTCSGCPPTCPGCPSSGSGFVSTGSRGASSRSGCASALAVLRAWAMQAGSWLPGDGVRTAQALQGRPAAVVWEQGMHGCLDAIARTSLPRSGAALTMGRPLVHRPVQGSVSGQSSGSLQSQIQPCSRSSSTGEAGL